MGMKAGKEEVDLGIRKKDVDGKDMLYKRIRTIASTVRDYAQKGGISSFGPALFYGVIETVRKILDVGAPSSVVKAMVLCTLVTLARCSLQTDMTISLVFGDYCLRYLCINRVALSGPLEHAEELFDVTIENAFKHLSMALTSCAISMASLRSNVHPGMKGPFQLLLVRNGS